MSNVVFAKPFLSALDVIYAFASLLLDEDGYDVMMVV